MRHVSRLHACLSLLALISCSSPSRPTSTRMEEAADMALDTDPGVVLIGAGDIASCSSSSKDEQTSSLVLQVLQEDPTALAFTAGDNVYDNGTAAEFASCYHPSWGRFKDQTRPVAGNHEYETGNANGYFDYFNGVGADSGVAGKRGKGWYSFDHGAWHVIVVNSDSHVGVGAGSAQRQWVIADLAANPRECTLAIWHHARFFSGSTSLDGRVEALWRVLYDAGADLVVSGHNHFYDRFAPQTTMGVRDDAYGIRQILAGGGGKGVSSSVPPARVNSEKRGAAFGVLKLTLRQASYDWEYLTIPGTTFTDAGSSDCHGPPPVNLPPTAGFRYSCTQFTCAFTDTSVDPENAMAKWSWKFGDGTTSSLRDPKRTFTKASTFTVKLTVTDGRGLVREVSKKVKVPSTNTNFTPVARFTQSCTDLTCNFTDTSNDADGAVTSWTWNFGDGTTATTQSPSNTYLVAGTYTVQLTVADAQGASTSTTATVTPTEPPPPE